MNRKDLSRMIDLIDDRYLHEAAISRHKFGISQTARAISAACLAILIFGAASFAASQDSAPPHDTVYIPKIEITQTADDIQLDMFGFIVYDGRVYTQAEYIDYSESPNIRNLAGEYLGTASANVNNSCVNPPLSSDEVYPENFTSNVSGDVYSVKGYDKSFRICIPSMYEGCGFMAFFECLNDISFSQGYEIFGDRIHLHENFSNVLQIDTESGQKSKISISEKKADEFFNALYDAQAIVSPDSTEYKLFQIAAKDGTAVNIRLYKGGIAAYKDCFVKFTDVDAFNLLYEYK